MRKQFILMAGVVLLTILTMFAGSLLETNDAGYFQIKQAAGTGEMTVRFKPGLYMQMFGDITQYKNVATIGFGREKGEGSADIEAIPVIFNDGSKAEISGLVRIKLPDTVEGALRLKKEYAQGYDHFINSGVLPVVRNAVKLAANLRSAQDAYTTLALFQQAVSDQLKQGPYVTRSDVIKVKRSTGEVEEKKVTVVVKDKNGNPKRLSNRIKELGCVVLEAVIDVPTFDKRVSESIARRKDEAMKTELAKQEAIRAKQDAITAKQKGLARVAQAKYEKEVEKVKAVTNAQKEFEVEKLNAKKALEEAKKVRAQGMAKAAANAALVKAGLTPREKAEIEMKTAIGIAEHLSKIELPGIMVIGENGKGGKVNPFDAIGIDALMKITDKIKKSN